MAYNDDKPVIETTYRVTVMVEEIKRWREKTSNSILGPSPADKVVGTEIVSVARVSDYLLEAVDFAKSTLDLTVPQSKL